MVLHTEETYYWEIDTGEEGHTQVKKKWEGYAGCQNLVLVVTTTEQRMETMCSRAKDAQFPVAFTTFIKVTRDPYGKIWTDPKGRVGALPKPTPKTTQETGA